MKRVFIVLGFSFLIFSCKKEESNDLNEFNGIAIENFKAEVPNAWFGLFLEMTKTTPGFTPPVAARAFGYDGLALYESIAPGSTVTHTLSTRLSKFNIGVVPGGGKTYFWPASANAALAEIARNLYRNKPANLVSIDSLENKINVSFSGQASAEAIENGADFGKKVGNSVYEYSKTDGQDECFLTNFPVGYQFVTGLGKWTPTPPAYQAIPIQPYWGSVRTFMYKNASITMPNLVPGFSSDPNSGFYAQALETYTISTNLTAEQEIIAKYWSDDPGLTSTPSGHSVSILKQVIEKENLNLEKAAVAYCKLGFAVHDAFVNCWKCKYQDNLIRPITYIRTYIDPTYNSLLSTPPFPEFPSGHSVQSGASALVLESLFGNDYAFQDKSNISRTDINGTPRNYESFSAFANEAAISRLYGGIHFNRAIYEGVTFGRNVGKNVVAFKMEEE
jgi:membrane-associated phospholipid phosphatase